ncbi:hypothetical protein H8959_001760 [Pygathrix nigripes]
MSHMETQKSSLTSIKTGFDAQLRISKLRHPFIPGVMDGEAGENGTQASHANRPTSAARLKSHEDYDVSGLRDQAASSHLRVFCCLFRARFQRPSCRRRCAPSSQLSTCRPDVGLAWAPGEGGRASGGPAGSFRLQTRLTFLLQGQGRGKSVRSFWGFQPLRTRGDAAWHSSREVGVGVGAGSQAKPRGKGRRAAVRSPVRQRARLQAAPLRSDPARGPRAPPEFRVGRAGPGLLRAPGAAPAVASRWGGPGGIGLCLPGSQEARGGGAGERGARPSLRAAAVSHRRRAPERSSLQPRRPRSPDPGRRRRLPWDPARRRLKRRRARPGRAGGAGPWTPRRPSASEQRAQRRWVTLRDGRAALPPLSLCPSEWAPRRPGRDPRPKPRGSLGRKIWDRSCPDARTQSPSLGWGRAGGNLGSGAGCRGQRLVSFRVHRSPWFWKVEWGLGSSIFGDPSATLAGNRRVLVPCSVFQLQQHENQQVLGFSAPGGLFLTSFDGMTLNYYDTCAQRTAPKGWEEAYRSVCSLHEDFETRNGFTEECLHQAFVKHLLCATVCLLCAVCLLGVVCLLCAMYLPRTMCLPCAVDCARSWGHHGDKTETRLGLLSCGEGGDAVHVGTGKQNARAVTQWLFSAPHRVLVASRTPQALS